MSLRSVHIFFIFVCTIFCIWFGLWSFQAYQETGTTYDITMGVLSLIASAALSVYFVWFIKKSRQLVWALVWSPIIFLSSSPSAWACATCFADQNSPIAKGANAGVMFLLVVVCAVLIGFAGLFIKWIRRAKKLGL